jgi:hypothetical protein
MITAWGKSAGQIMQTAYIVGNIQEAINWWVSDLRVGPWFLLDSFINPDQIYRGVRSDADITLAMAFVGDMQIELIQPKDDRPSVYKETYEARGWGFHHVGIGSLDIEADIRAYEARGYALAFKAAVPTGGDVAYMDGGPARPGFIELLPMTAGFNAGFAAMWSAARGWDGTDPVRAFG